MAYPFHNDNYIIRAKFNHMLSSSVCTQSKTRQHVPLFKCNEMNSLVSTHCSLNVYMRGHTPISIRIESFETLSLNYTVSNEVRYWDLFQTCSFWNLECNNLGICNVIPKFSPLDRTELLVQSNIQLSSDGDIGES